MPSTVFDRIFISELTRQIEELDQHLIVHVMTCMLMALVPAGKFLTNTEGLPFELDLPAYYMAIHPVSNAQYAQFVNETEHRKAECSSHCRSSVWNFPSEKADYPAVFVNWDDATAYCRWAGLKLPTELEWKKAARGQDGRAFPWGQMWDPSRCRNTMNKDDETTARLWCCGHGGAPFGGLQLSSNVWEWCADCYDDRAYSHYREGDLSSAAFGEYRAVRGGSWNRGSLQKRPYERYGDPWTSDKGMLFELKQKWERERAILDFSAGRRARRLVDARDQACGFRCALDIDVSHSDTLNNL